jgi:hypothetical protein
MQRPRRPSPRAAVAGALALSAALMSAAGLSAQAPKFFPDDPLAREPDPFDASHVQPFPLHRAWGYVSNLFLKEGSQTPSPSKDVNTVDEVPDSSWFTNRVGTVPLSEADVARGPNTTNGPVGRWTIIAGKSEGVRPGFTVRDEAGVVWFIKFDPPGYPEQATGAEVVSTKLFWALGYHVAETHVATIRREDVTLDPAATIKVGGRRRALTKGDVDQVFSEVDRSRDGSYRALASKDLEGKPVDGFLYYGTRSDDPNDIVPHEDRRELRAMRVFAAWIDRVDAKARNTLDTLVKVDGRTVVRHHVLDFGSTLGSGGIGPNQLWEGYEYLYSDKEMRKLPGFGFPIEYWRRIPYPTIRGIGCIEADHFVPDRWRSRVPNAAYRRADADDNFWAARKLMAMTDGLIAAAVRSGHYTDPRAEAYLTATLIKRRDVILRAYLPAINPVISPSLDAGGVLAFANAAVVAHVARPPARYQARWYRFDNRTRASTPLGDSESAESVLRAPTRLPAAPDAFVRVDISAVAPAHPAWALPVRAFFCRRDGGWVLVGLERTVPPTAPSPAAAAGQ